MKKQKVNTLVRYLLIIGIILLTFNGCSPPDDKKIGQKVEPKELKKESIIQATYNCVSNDSKAGSILCTLSNGEICEVRLTATVEFDPVEFKSFINKQLKSGQTVYLERTDNFENNTLERNVWLKNPTIVSYDTNGIDRATASNYLLQALLVKNGISSVVESRNNYQGFLHDLETDAIKNKLGQYAKWNSYNLNKELKARNKN